jgi:hypothetical protein
MYYHYPIHLARCHDFEGSNADPMLAAMTDAYIASSAQSRPLLAQNAYGSTYQCNADIMTPLAHATVEA